MEKYFKGKGLTYEFGKCGKKTLSQGTGIYAIEVRIEGWPIQHYALVLVARARVQGVIVLDREEIKTVVGMLDEGLREEF